MTPNFVSDNVECETLTDTLLFLNTPQAPALTLQSDGIKRAGDITRGDARVSSAHHSRTRSSPGQVGWVPVETQVQAGAAGGGGDPCTQAPWWGAVLGVWRASGTWTLPA